ncbi:MAG: amidase [Ferruginibacter sp.]
MKRRNFIANTALATTAIGTFLQACTNQKSSGTTTKNNIDSKVGDDFELLESSIAGLQQQMEMGTYSAVQITQLYLDRINAIDKNGPTLGAVIEINPDALSIAMAMDAERKAGKIRGPLHGIPVLIKDNINSGDTMQTTAGSLALAGNKAKKDAFIIQKLRDAGAVLLGKTNLSEWANFRSSQSCSGWSSRGGQTRSPYILDHNPCGSSSGSGVAVAANLCTVAIGTETDGSIVCPAAVAGIVGLKPTVGLWSRSGIIPISHTQDTAGPMGRTVADVAALLGLLTGEDSTDSITANSKGKAFTDYRKYLDKDALKGKRIGVEKKLPGSNHLLHAIQKEVLQQLTQLGATVVEVEYLDKINALGDAEYQVLQYEFKDGVNKYLQQNQAPVASLADVIAFNKANEDKAMPYFKQDTLEKCEAKGGLNSKEYLEALKKSHDGGKKVIDDILKLYQLDAIAGLTMGPSCSIDMIYGDRWGDVFLTQPAAISGYPHITVPCGTAYHLPVGWSFFSKAYSEPLLIGLGYAYEQASKKRKVPDFKKAFF